MEIKVNETSSVFSQNISALKTTHSHTHILLGWKPFTRVNWIPSSSVYYANKRVCTLMIFIIQQKKENAFF